MLEYVWYLLLLVLIRVLLKTYHRYTYQNKLKHVQSKPKNIKTQPAEPTLSKQEEYDKLMYELQCSNDMDKVLELEIELAALDAAINTF